MHNEDSVYTAMAIISTIAAIVCGIIFKFSQTTGADFSVLFNALYRFIILGVVIVALNYCLPNRLILILIAALIPLALISFPVLDNICANSTGLVQHDILSFTQEVKSPGEFAECFFGSNIIKGGVIGAILIALITFWRRSRS